MTTSARDRILESKRRWARKRARAGQDIGDIPSPVDPERRRAAEASLRLFLETYFPAAFSIAWCPDHRRLIETLEQVLTVGGLRVFAIPRGSGKTTITERACIWAVLTGRRRFPFLVGASHARARSMLRSIAGELDGNPLLAEDFPEACFPAASLEGVAQRAKHQRYQGERTGIEWGKDAITLATIPGAACSGATIRVAGITGSIRGANALTLAGEVLRPDVAVVDDPQTHLVARSELQVKRRLELLYGDVLGLAGPRQKIACVVPCTVIQPNDLSDQLLKNPEWKPIRCKLLYSLPARQDLWDDYADCRRAELAHGGDGSEATVYYAEHRAEMDRGAQAAWAERYDDGEISAIQHGMNLLIKDAPSFHAEYQNDPMPEFAEDADLPTAAEIQERRSGYPAGVCPPWASHLTAFIDVQHTCLYWIVCAWSQNFTGSIIAYGCWPDPRRPYFSTREIRQTLAVKYGTGSVQAGVRAGLQELTNLLCSREWLRDEGGPLRLGRLLIDCNDDAVTDQVLELCKTSPHAAILKPSRGRGYGPTDVPIDLYKKRPGEFLGYHFLIGRFGRRAASVLTIDANFWKSFSASRLKQSLGEPGALSLYGDRSADHRLIADHLTAERRDRVRHEKTQRVVDLWTLRPARTENHWFDGVVGCCVGAAMLGSVLPGVEGYGPGRPPIKRRPREAMKQ